MTQVANIQFKNKEEKKQGKKTLFDIINSY